MKHLLAQAGRSFLRAFGASLIILAPGILAAPNLNAAYLLGVAALFSAIAAGFKAIQVFVPQLSFSGFVPQPYGAWLDSFVRGFLGAFITLSFGVLNAPDLHTLRAAVVAVLVGALSAGLRAVEGLLTVGELPKVGSGLTTPDGGSTPPVKA